MAQATMILAAAAIDLTVTSPAGVSHEVGEWFYVQSR
jgi:hypothetical protein